MLLTLNILLILLYPMNDELETNIDTESSSEKTTYLQICKISCLSAVLKPAETQFILQIRVCYGFSLEHSFIIFQIC